MEGLYKGQQGTPLILMGIVNPAKEKYNDNVEPVLVPLRIPKMLSFLGYRDFNAFVPGIQDIIDGGYTTINDTTKALSFEQKKMMGQTAINALKQYKEAEKANDTTALATHKAVIDANYKYFGYGYLDKPEDSIPNVPLIFYSFHLMVVLGFFFIALFLVILFYDYKKILEKQKWLLWVALFTIPLGYLAGELGWIVAEVGRQPWAIQDVLPVQAAISSIQTSSVQITFFLFLVLFTALLIAEVRIMLKQIKKGPAEY